VVGIAPLMEDVECVYGFKMRKLAFIWNKHVPRCDFIVSAHRTDVYRALWDYIIGQARRWDLLLLPQLPEGSPTLTFFKEMASASGFIAATWSAEGSQYVPIAGSWEEYFDRLPRKHRSNLRSKIDRLASQGKVQFERIAGEEADIHSALDETFEIAGSPYDAKVKLFYSNLARSSSIRSSVRLHFLRAGSKRIAFDFSLRHGNSMYQMKGGHLPEFSAYSPTNILTSMNLERCFREGLQRYDFLGKDEEWRTRWCNEVVSHHWMFIYPNNPRTAVFHAMKFRLAPMVQELEHLSGISESTAA
jgi:predicted N-acyltransferase